MTTQSRSLRLSFIITTTALCALVSASQGAIISGSNEGLLSGRATYGNPAPWDATGGAKISVYDGNAYLMANSLVPDAHAVGGASHILNLSNIVDYAFYEASGSFPYASLPDTDIITHTLVGDSLGGATRQATDLYTTTDPAGVGAVPDHTEQQMSYSDASNPLTGTISLSGLDPAHPVDIYLVTGGWTAGITASLTEYSGGVAGDTTNLAQFDRDDFVGNVVHEGQYVIKGMVSNFSDIDRVDFSLAKYVNGGGAFTGMIVTGTPVPDPVNLTWNLGTGGDWDTGTANWTGGDTTWPNWSDNATFGGIGTSGSGILAIELEDDIDVGTLSLNATDDGGTFSIVETGGTAGSLNFGGNTPQIIANAAGTLAAPIAATSADITKTGAGTLTVTGNSSSYTGTVTVDDGVLILDGSLGGDVTVASGTTTGALAGNGSIGGDLTLDPGAKLRIDGGTLSVTGSVLLDTSFGVDDLLSSNWSAFGPGTYTLIDTTSTNFTLLDLDNWGFANAEPLGNGRLGYFQQGSLQLVVIPEPSTAILAGLGLAGLTLRRRRRSA